ncbi:GNAT family N-acetyltransferase [uncultured Deinococcus sp.]|uniref:GNAT family N-acetyltransferase n=1 Tax=uncultured Deinococcus sp. TaxID=158789 RepID=UPI0025908344|nr:GNAT family N-acetyltransferase [uncultured Deinococcus sp.]
MTATLLRLARAEAAAHTRFGALGTVARFGPLVAVASGQHLPTDTAWHDGTGTPNPDEWAAFEAFCAAQGQAATLNLLSHAAPALLPDLNGRGYGLDYVLHAYTHDFASPPPAPGWPVHEDPDPGRWAALAAQGFGPGTEAIMRLVAGVPGTRRFVATVGGEAAGTGAYATEAGVAALHGTATRPEFRGRGVQAALLAFRLAQAAREGADLASVFVTPGSGSERNVVRAGFRLAGLRLTFTRRS